MLGDEKKSIAAVVNLSPESPSLASFVDLLENDIGGRGAIELVERNRISKLLQEQELRALQGRDSSVSIEVGKTLRADFLVLMSTAEGKQQAARLRVLESRYGLRLFDEVFTELGVDVRSYVADLMAAFAMAMKNGPTQVYAVAPFTNRDIRYRFDRYQDVLPFMLRQALLRQGRMVLEVEEARRLIDERKVSPTQDAPTVMPGDVLMIEGDYSVKQETNEQVSLVLTLTTGSGRTSTLSAAIPCEDKGLVRGIESLA
ncbi:MAG: hypothetical protein AAB393_19095, partial [Bacteroidota bacterium]